MLGSGEGSPGAAKQSDAASSAPASSTAIPAALLRSFRIWSKRPMNEYSASCEVRPKIQGTSQPKPAGPAALMKRDLIRAYGVGIIARCQPADKCPVAVIGFEASVRMCGAPGSQRVTAWSSQLAEFASRAHLGHALRSGVEAILDPAKERKYRGLQNQQDPRQPRP